MLRLYLILSLIVGSLSAYAQKGLAINEVFSSKYATERSSCQYINNPGFCLGHLKGRLNVLALYRDPDAQYAAEIEAMIRTDSRGAKGRNTVYKGNTLTNATYVLAPVKDAEGRPVNRYIYYYHLPKKGLMLVYIEGRLKPDEAKELITDFPGGR